ncbi:MAG: M48 family metallopeptidase [Thermodesulfobacteriota bacterium]|nr:M48 family metallopeptidase [Thermodesulfobacteriota bacterium]
MSKNTNIPLAIIVVFVVLLLQGCANTLFITYRSDPPGAVLYEGQKNLGYTPKSLDYKITPEAEKIGYMKIAGTCVKWADGETACIPYLKADLSIGLNQQFTFTRPDRTQKYTPSETGTSGTGESKKGIADVLTPQDLVTGKRTLNLEPEEEEIKRATNQTNEILNNFRNKGIPIDNNQKILLHLQKMMKDIAEVSHRPNLPWEIHLIGIKDFNAFTIGGGKLFAFAGLFSELKNVNELAAVLAHEIAHVNCRHVGKSMGFSIVSMFSKGTDMFRASFTTVQEAEADRVGLLYMALAGYDPSAAPSVWKRMHEKFGSSPGNYSYDHPLNVDRYKKLSELTPIALKYFKGNGIRNQDYERLRVENDLIPRTSSFAGDSDLLALLEGAAGTTSDILGAKIEEKQRKIKMQEDLIKIQQSLKIVNLKIANTKDGYKGVFFKLQNIGNSVIKSVEVTLHYYDAAGTSIYSEKIPISSLYLSPGSIKEWGTYLKSVSGYKNIGAVVTNIE